MDVKSLIILIWFCVLILYSNLFAECDVPFGYCVDLYCTVPIGKGKTSIQYNSPDDTRISVKAGEGVDIFVKGYGPKKDLLGIVVRGIKGYISQNFIREEITFYRNPVLVPAEVDFKYFTPDNSYTVTNQLHVSPHHHKSQGVLNSVLESHIHRQTVHQQDSISPTHSSSHPQFSNPRENLQASQFHPKGPEKLYHQRDFPDSAFDSPELSSHFSSDYDDNLLSSNMALNPDSNILSNQPFLSDTASPIHQQNVHSSFSNNIPNSVSNINPSNPDFHSSGSFHRESSISNLDIQSSNQLPPNVEQQNYQHATNFREQHVQPSPIINQPHLPSSGQQQFSEHDVHQHSGVPHEQFPQTPNFQHNNIHPQASTQQQNSHLHSDAQQQNLHQPLGMQQQNIDPNLMAQHQHFHQPLIMQQQNIDPQSNLQWQNVHQPLSMQHQNIDPHSSTHNQPLNTQNLKPDGPENSQDPYSDDEDYSKTMSLVEKFDMSDSVHDNHLPQSSQNAEDVTKKSISEVDTSDSEQPALQRSNSFPLSASNINPSTVDASKIEPSLLIKKFNTKVENFEDGNDISRNEEQGIDNEFDFEIDDAEDYEAFDTDAKEAIPVDSQHTKSNQDLNLETSMSLSHDKKSPDIEILTAFDYYNDFSVFQDPIQNQETSTINQKEEILKPNDPLSSLEQKDSVQLFENDEVINSHTDALPNSEKLNESIPKSIDNFQNLPDVIDSSVLSTNISSGIISNQKFESENKNIEGENASNSEKNNGVLHEEDSANIAKINEIFDENERNSEMNSFFNMLDIEGSNDLKTTYQVRNLKEDSTTTEEPQHAADGSHDENITQINSDFFGSFQNGLNALRSIVDFIMSWIPEPLYSMLTDLQTKGISPRVPVFTFICGFMIILLIVPLYFIKESSKEAKLSAQLASAERYIYTLSSTNTLLEEKLLSAQTLLGTSETTLEEGKKISELLKSKLQKQFVELENTKDELESSLSETEALRKKENEYLTLLTEREKQKQELLQEKITLEQLAKENEDSIASLANHLQETEETVKELEKEKTQYMQLKSDYEEKLAQFERNCNQLLQEAEVWNLRVNELNDKVKEEKAAKDEVELSLKEKDGEMESLKQLVETFKSFEELEDPEEKEKTKEEKLQTLLKTSMVLNQLDKQVEENKLLLEQLEKERNKILDMEVELLDAKSEIDKLKLSYNQALQDKAEAQTKLDVLTNYFKDKEIQLQKQLGVHEAVRQKKEEDATSAERRVILIEQENTSYKYQVASMKQEMEETERNLKSQIAVQEKKAHENWIAARAAERKHEETKQEITQLRQRLTLLEREHENWVNTSRDEILRPVPQRIPGVNDESGQDLNITDRGMFPPLHERLPPHMLLPPDRPLPPLLPPMFMPHMERFRPPPPWHLPQDSQSDFRPPPPEFIGGRNSTPPRGRQFAMEGDLGPHASSPITTDNRDSVNSTPPHSLPDFHDIPPQTGRPPFFPPPLLGPHRLPMHPPFRRDMGPHSKRPDNPNEYSSRGPQQRPPPEEWQQSRV